jgi:TonB family protein
MIAAWMLYCIAIAVLFVVVGEALERALHLAGRATRWAWVAALAGSYLVPGAAMFRPSAFGALPVPLAHPVASGPITLQDAGAALPPPTRSFSLGDLDAVLAWAWGLSSAALLLSLGATALRLAMLRRGWRSATVDGRAVLVSDKVGPAVVGLWRPLVVLPEWALQLGAREQRLMLAHEDEHIRAGDPWLLAAAAAALLLAPWNPVVWWQVRRLRLVVEMDCDARVLAREGDAPEYGELLLRVGRRRARLPLGAPALGEPVSFLGRRIRRMVTTLPRWRWAGATVAGLVAAAAFIGACETPRPVGPKAASELPAGATPTLGPYSPDATYLQALAHQYHPEAFAHPLPSTAIAFVFDEEGNVMGHAAGMRETRDHDCLAVVDRLVPGFRASKWSSGGCAGVYKDTTVVVYWKSLRPEFVKSLRRLAHQYHPDVFAHPLPGAAVAFVFDAQGNVVGHAAGVREARDNDCLAVVDRLVPALHANEFSSGGCAEAAEKGKVVVYWKKLKQAEEVEDVLAESMVDEKPTFLSGPPLQYPNLLRQAGVQGRVIVRAIIDTTGRAEPGSVQVVESPHPGFDQAARNAVLQARFRGGRFRGRAVRVLIEFPVEFRTR